MSDPALIAFLHELCQTDVGKEQIFCCRWSVLIDKTMCLTFKEDHDIDFYAGFSSSTFNTILYTVMYILLMVVWPLRHWAMKVAFTNAGHDEVLLYR